PSSSTPATLLTSSGDFEIAITGYLAGVAPCLHRMSFTWWDHVWAELHCVKEHFVESWLAMRIMTQQALHLGTKKRQAPGSRSVEEATRFNIFKEISPVDPIRKRLCGTFANNLNLL
ncbi:unnamed protein product, partial [Amoebophrya sp. A120]